MKKKHLYISILVITVAGYLLVQWAQPKPVDWSPSYSGLAKKPYGCFIARNVLDDIFPDHPIRYRNIPIFKSRDSTSFQNEIYINSSFSPDQYESEILLERAHNGKNIFISAHTLDGPLSDSLQLKVTDPPIFSAPALDSKWDSLGLNFTSKRESYEGQWHFPKMLASPYFTDFDSSATTIMGSNENGETNFIKIKHGNGKLYVHTVPYVFTNYFMRDYQKTKYASRVLSHLPIAPTVWDEYNKDGRMVNTSPLRYIVSHPHLKWAWITALIGLALFLVFRAKRRQRVIPVIEKPTNSTVEFTKTIGRLYYQNGDHKDIASKKIKYLLEHIRENLNLDTQNINDNFLEHLSQRSGADHETVRTLFNFIDQIQNKENISSDELWYLNKNIESFYQQSSR
ncbi:hypothetical protein CK503_12050 [Aliifodinibius salipaludis]|uniref:DUF4350 domain-containing protein n=1 Tax=Fodinibius salipaludis TaxID=2032627 RepID=A0A2A2G6R3_9BACT|nr:DUF4350 domain-containing protein [Aliifodinibius salipaludis]PAU93456.1 hypothetical protein CK503_12050 [Aliifodinibius salipaludis]